MFSTKVNFHFLNLPRIIPANPDIRYFQDLKEMSVNTELIFNAAKIVTNVPVQSETLRSKLSRVAELWKNYWRRSIEKRSCIEKYLVPQTIPGVKSVSCSPVCGFADVYINYLQKEIGRLSQRFNFRTLLIAFQKNFRQKCRTPRWNIT